jgi:Sulfotransferase family
MAFENRYSLLDRSLHRLSFGTRSVQVGLADIEQQVFRKQLQQIAIHEPVFVTGLPRAGTTLLLELCVASGEFATHTYRDMPFILTPMLWRQFSAKFAHADVPRERAHGDGMLVSVDSPEAFEEIVWHTFWKSQYQSKRIIPWGSANDEDFTSFFHNHVKKIIALHSDGLTSRVRYISKNNLNIARIGLIKRCIADAIVIVPFRQPLQHAASLLLQHRNFLTIHAEDTFAREYMAGIGHFDFGENLRPINFDNWLESARYKDATTINFWLEYWTACYGSLLRKAGSQVHLLSYEGLCNKAATGLNRLADVLRLANRDEFIAQASRMKQSTSYSTGLGEPDSELLERANVLHRNLLDASLQ